MNGTEAIKELQRVYDSVVTQGGLDTEAIEDVRSRLNAVIEFLETEYGY